MSGLSLPWVRRYVHALDPRRSLGTKVGWFVATLAIAFAFIAALWLGNMTREGLRQQHGRQLTLDAGQLANSLDQAVRARIHSLQTIAAIIGTDIDFDEPRVVRRVLDELQAANPELEWIGFVDTRGVVRAATQGRIVAPDGIDPSWLQRTSATWIGQVHAAQALPSGHPGQQDAGRGDHIIVMAAPVRDSRGRSLGMIAARLDWSWVLTYAAQLPQTLRQRTVPETLITDREGLVIAGPPEFVGKPWAARPVGRIDVVDWSQPRPEAAPDSLNPGVERLDDGRVLLVSGFDSRTGGALHELGWTLRLIEPALRADRRADTLWSQIIRASLVIGGVAALFGVLVSRRLTLRLAQLSASVDSAGSHGDMQITVPPGKDEITRLGQAFADLVGALKQERGELSALGAELEQRVAARTREVERLARETRYAAVVRERLKLARDLHDTLAHSMMAMLAEIRLLRKLYARDPAGLSAELAQAEKVAHEGLLEARASITRMRVNPVRDIGLGAAIAEALGKLAERTGLQVETDFDPLAAGFAEETAEAVFRIVEEGIRNIERHARAGHVKAVLRCEGERAFSLELSDDGSGFDTHAPHAGHFGIVGMGEQAQLIGAKVTICSFPGKGTALHLVFGSGIDG